jgi:hypothetical protein
VSKNSVAGVGAPLTLHELAASVLAHGFDGKGTTAAEHHSRSSTPRNHFNQQNFPINNTDNERPLTTATVMSGTDINVNVNSNGHSIGQLHTIASMVAAGLHSGSLTSPPLSPDPNNNRIISVASRDHALTIAASARAVNMPQVPLSPITVGIHDGLTPVEPLTSFQVRWGAPPPSDVPQSPVHPVHYNGITSEPPSAPSPGGIPSVVSGSASSIPHSKSDDMLLTVPNGPRFHDDPPSSSPFTTIGASQNHPLPSDGKMMV